jgi:nucleotide-binding universal stress UspA family protein
MAHVLCPVDFSDLSALALRYAVRLAGCLEAGVAVLYAEPFSPPPYFTPGQIASLESEFRESRRQAAGKLREFVAQALGPDAPQVEIRIAEEAPADAIHRAAEELGAEAVVMGTHGRTGINRLMLGSVAERVLRESRIPVLTVRGAERPIRSILCPVNQTPAAREAAGLAAKLARCFGAQLTLAHVREPGSDSPAVDPCSLVPAGARSGCDIRELTREGDAAREILALASESACDLLVVGAQHRPFFDATVIGATTARVVRHSPCPVLTVAAE